MDKLVNWQTLFRVAVAVGVCSLFAKLIPLFLFLSISILIGVGLSPVVDFLKNKFKFPTWLAHTSIMISTLLLVFALFFFLIPSIVNQIFGFAKHLPEYRKTLEDSILSEDLRNLIHSNIDKIPETMGSLPAKVAQAGQMAVHTLYQFILLIILSLYFLVDGNRAYQAVLSQVSKYGSDETKIKVQKTAKEMKEVIFAYAFGQILTCSFVAVYVYAVTRILHVPGALTLAAIATICDLVPVVGFLSSLAIGALIAFTVTPTTGVLLIALYLLYSLVENYVIVPRVYGQTMKLSRLVVLLSILIGGEIAGIEGMLIVLPLVGSWHVIEKYWIDHRVKRARAA